MLADSTPPPLSAQILEEFADAAWAGQVQADQMREDARAMSIERRRARDRDRKQMQRAIDAAVRRESVLRRLRAIDGIEERECACGCGRMFPVEYRNGGGRQREYATLECCWRAVKRAWRKVRSSNG
jgi:hypothetical protein